MTKQQEDELYKEVFVKVLVAYIQSERGYNNEAVDDGFNAAKKAATMTVDEIKKRG